MNVCIIKPWGKYINLSWLSKGEFQITNTLNKIQKSVCSNLKYSTYADI